MSDGASITYQVREIPIKRIRAFAGQPRKYFDPDECKARAESMKLLGQQTPVTVEAITGDPDHDYELIDGESRLRSAIEAGLTTLWAAVRSVPFASQAEKHMVSLVANFNRSEHTALEISDALQYQIVHGGRSQAELASALGRSLSYVYQYLLLQRLHPAIRAMMDPSLPKDKQVATHTAVELARHPQDKQLRVAQLAARRSGRLSRREVREALGQSSRGTSLRGVNSLDVIVWTADRVRRSLEFRKPDPEHVAHLRAGIEQFRTLLEARYNDGNTVKESIGHAVRDPVRLPARGTARA